MLLDEMKGLNVQHYTSYFNMDETPIYFDIPRLATFDFHGVTTVKVKTTGNEKLRFTVLLTAGVRKNNVGEWKAEKLPIMVIFENLCKPPNGKLPSGMVILCSEGGTITE